MTGEECSELAASLKSWADSKTLVYLCIPTRGTVDAVTVNSLIKTASVLERANVGSIAQVLITGGGGISMGREMCISVVLQSPCTHIVFVDSDVGWHPSTIVRLLRSNLDFCAAVYQMRQDAGPLCFEALPGEPPVSGGFIEVQHVGMGMVVLKRSVIEAMSKHYSQLAYRGEDGRTRCGLFLEMIEGGHRYGEDYAFCRRWRAMGGKIWIDPRAEMMHAGRKDWTARVADRYRAIWPRASNLP